MSSVERSETMNQTMAISTEAQHTHGGAGVAVEQKKRKIIKVLMPVEKCPGCLRVKHTKGYDEVRCVRCCAEMCNECFSVSPVEGDDDAYCKRCAQERLDEKEADEEVFECPRCNCVLRGDDANERRMWISTDPDEMDPNDGYDVCDDCEEDAMAEEKAKR